MKNYYIAICLSISLVIYLCYRVEQTWINQIAIYFFSFEKYDELRKVVYSITPLNDIIIYSLPEGLWVFCATLASRGFFVKINSYRIYLIYFPLLFAITLEFMQLLHVINGRFDFWDIVLSLFCWVLALLPMKSSEPPKHILKPFNQDSLICLFVYLIVYLAHVSY